MLKVGSKRDPLAEAIGYLNQALIFMGHTLERLEKTDRALADAGHDRDTAPIVNVRAEAQDLESHLRGLLLAVEDRQATRMAVDIVTRMRGTKERTREASTPYSREQENQLADAEEQARVERAIRSAEQQEQRGRELDAEWRRGRDES